MKLSPESCGIQYVNLAKCDLKSICRSKVYISDQYNNSMFNCLISVDVDEEVDEFYYLNFNPNPFVMQLPSR